MSPKYECHQSMKVFWEGGMYIDIGIRFEYIFVDLSIIIMIINDDDFGIC